MKMLARSLLLLLLAGLAACGTSSTTTAPVVPDNPFVEAKAGTDSTLEVMTWNLRDFPQAGRSSLTTAEAAKTVDLVCKAVAAVDADIVAMQEIASGSYFDQVVARLDDWDGLRATSAYASLNLAFLYRNDGSLEIDSAPYEILTDEGYFLPRSPYVLQGRFNGQPFVVINNHFKAYHDTESVERRRQASLLLEQYVLDTFPDVRVVIVGDLNDELDDPPAENVFANFLADTVHWRFADLPIALGQGGLVSYPGYGSHIDHILITDELFAAAEKAEALVEVVPLHALLPGGLSTYNRELSDHLPVLLRLMP